MTSVRPITAPAMPAIAPNIPEPSCIVAISHPTNAPLMTRAENPMACVREGVFGSTSQTYSPSSHRQDDTPDAAAHEQHCSHRRKGAKPRDKAEAQGK